jgi:hypothetical protein
MKLYLESNQINWGSEVEQLILVTLKQRKT